MRVLNDGSLGLPPCTVLKLNGRVAVDQGVVRLALWADMCKMNEAPTQIRWEYTPPEIHWM